MILSFFSSYERDKFFILINRKFIKLGFILTNKRFFNTVQVLILQNFVQLFIQSSLTI